LSGNDHIHNEVHYVASNVTFLKNAEFVCSVNKYQPLLVARERFLDREGPRRTENIN